MPGGHDNKMGTKKTGTKWWKDKEEIEWYKEQHLQGKTRRETERAWHNHTVFRNRDMPRLVVDDMTIANWNLTSWL